MNELIWFFSEALDYESILLEHKSKSNIQHKIEMFDNISISNLQGSQDYLKCLKINWGAEEITQ